MLCVLTLKVAVLHVALPAVSVTAAQIVAAPSLKSTVPVGEATAVVPGAVTFTVAVKVTDCPNTDGLAEELKLVVVSALFTTCDTGELVLAMKPLSPL